MNLSKNVHAREGNWWENLLLSRLQMEIGYLEVTVEIIKINKISVDRERKSTLLRIKM